MRDTEVELELIQVDFNDAVSLVDHDVSSGGNQGNSKKGFDAHMKKV